MPPSVPHVAILIVCYNGRRYLGDCLDSLLGAENGDLQPRIVIVDNASTDDSVAFITTHYPQTELIQSPVNLGFAGGNNLGWQHIQSHYPGTRYLALLNQDTLVDPRWLRPLVDYLESHPPAAAVQPKLLLHPDTAAFNSAGNRSHFLGFGFTTAYRQPDLGQFKQPVPIDFPSGAAVLIRTAALRQVGFFDDTFFAYLEDADLGWKLRQAGWVSVFLPDSAVYHKYSFNKNIRFYYYLERNRWHLLAVYYKLPTLLLLLPALLLMELGQFVFALQHRHLHQKVFACLYYLRPSRLAHILAHRRLAQHRRTLSDRQFLRSFAGQLDFPEISHPLLRYVANPLFGLYWKVTRPLIFW